MRRPLIPLMTLALLATAAPTVAQTDAAPDGEEGVARTCLRFVSTAKAGIDADADPAEDGADAVIAPDVLDELVGRLPYDIVESVAGQGDPFALAFVFRARDALSDADRALVADALHAGLLTIGTVEAAVCESDEATADVDELIATMADGVPDDTDASGVDDPDTGVRTDEPDPADGSGASEQGAGNERTPYSRFVARGVKAVIDLAVLAEESRGAEGVDAVVAAARRLERWAGGQQKWLRNHPPQRCYGNAHKRWREHIGLVEAGARDLRLGVRELDAVRAARGVRRIGNGARRLDAIDFDATSERCLEAARGS